MTRFFEKPLDTGRGVWSNTHVNQRKGARMAYTTVNFKSKAALKRAIAEGQEVGAFPPGLGTVPDNGAVSLEGPHYPAPHTWYATATLRDGVIVSVK